MAAASRKRSGRGYLAFASLLAAALMSAGCSAGASHSPAAPTSTEGAAVVVKTEKVEKRSMGDPREQVADVAASVHIGLIAQASGTVAEVLKRNGQAVDKGQVIARLGSVTAALSVTSAEAALRSAEKLLTAARADAKTSRSQLEAAIKGYEEQLKAAVRDGGQNEDSIQASLEAAKLQLAALSTGSAVASAEAQLELAKLNVQQAKAGYEGFEIKAPAAGTLSDFDLAPGGSVSQGSAVGTLQNASEVVIHAELSQASAKLLQGKKQLEVYYADKRTEHREAAVIYLSDLPSPTTRLYALELRASNGDGFFTPGTRVQVQITTAEEEEVAAVPSLSVVREGAGTYVFLLNGGQAQKREIKLGRLNGTYQEVLEGLRIGEDLIVSGQHNLKDGERVTLAQSAQ